MSPALDTPNNIRTFRQAKGWTLQQLADACATSKSQIDKLEKGQRRLTVEWMVRLARPLGCDPRDLLAAAFAPLAAQKTQTTDAPLATLPVRGLTMAPGGLHFAFTAAPIDQMPRPALLAHTEGAYAFYVAGETMAPMYRPRQILFVNPHKPPIQGGGVVVEMKDGQAVLAEFQGTNKDGIALRLYAPKTRALQVKLSAIAALHSVVASIEPQ